MAATKWNKGTRKEEKANRAVYVEKSKFEGMKKDILSLPVISVPAVVERCKVVGSVARQLILCLIKEDKVTPVIQSSHLSVYKKVIKE